MDITPLLSTFTLIAVAELADKTQLTVIALAASYDRAKVFTGVMLALAVVTALGVVVGESLLRMVDAEFIRIIAGIVFVAFGIWIILSKAGCNINASPLSNIVLSTFSMIALAEMGDKTQLSAIALAAKFGSPYLVFAGAIIALALLSLLGILAGKKLCEAVSLSKIRWASGALFIVFGLLFLAGF